MAIDEESRHRLFVRLQEVLGAEEATVLMEHLPPVGWADVATKHDLQTLRRELELMMEAMEYRMLATVRAEMAAQTRSMIHAMIFSTSAAVVTVGGLAVGAARLL